jgi:hypothetical protein
MKSLDEKKYIGQHESMGTGNKAVAFRLDRKPLIIDLRIAIASQG